MTPALTCDLALALYSCEPRKTPWARIYRAGGYWFVAWANGPQPRPTYNRMFHTRREARDYLRTLRSSREAFR